MKSVRLFAMMLAATAFAACEEDEEITGGGNGNGGNDSIPVVAAPVSSGVLILNNGNTSSGIEGDFTTVDYAAGFSAASGRFAAVNGRSLGDTPNAACIYGNRIYTAVTSSNTVEVCAKDDFRSVKQISFAGNADLSHPRSVVGKDGYVYVSFFSGYVCKIDTLDFNVAGTVALGEGTYPEKIAIAGDKLYVPNSGYGSGTTVSEIDLATFAKTRDITVPVNPTQMATDAEGNVYLLCYGTYDASWNQIGAAVHRLDLATGNHVKVADATMMDIPQGTNMLYVVNSPYGASTVSYASVDLAQTPYNAVSLPVSADSPAAIAADPVNGNIVLTSYNLENGFASYSTPGYANIYNAAGELQKRVDTGVGPCGIYFFTEHLD